MPDETNHSTAASSAWNRVATLPPEQDGEHDARAPRMHSLDVDGTQNLIAAALRLLRITISNIVRREICGD